MTKKTIAVLVCTVILAASSTIGGTLAYLTDSDGVTNTFTVGNVDIGLQEPSWNPGAGDGQGILPGDTYTKDPKVTASQGDSYMRIKMEIIDSSTDTVITDQARVNKILQTIYYDAPSGSLHLSKTSSYTLSQLAALTTVNNTSFVYDTAASRTAVAGIRYYNYIDADNIFSTSHADTATLFTNVAVPTDFINADIALIGNYKIKLTAQAVQSDNVADAASAYTLLDTTFHS